MDLSLPPEESNTPQDVNDTHDQNLPISETSSVSVQISVNEVTLQDKKNDPVLSIAVQMNDELSVPNSSLEATVLNIDGAGTVIVPGSSPISDSYLERTTQSICIKVSGKISIECPPSAVNNSIFLAETIRDIGTQTSESSTDPTSNPLVAHGLVSRELYDLLTPPDAKIPAGRKRPLQIQSKAKSADSF